MLRNYNVFPCVTIVMLSCFLGVAQETTKYKEVLLNDKPARLNVETGEITLLEKSASTTKVFKDAEIVTKPTVIDSLVSSQQSNFYIVKKDETLLDIANRFNTTLTQLKRANNLETTLVDEGQSLKVRNFEVTESFNLSKDGKQTEVVKPKALPKPTATEVSYTKSTTDYHNVLKGQTLYSIAKLYELSIDKLKQENGLSSNLIKVGQQLQIANFDTVNATENSLFWTVVKGDTLYSIAKANQVTVQQIKLLNGLDSNIITIGQKLKLR